MSNKYDCPIAGCSRTFNTEQGMELHLSIIHDDGPVVPTPIAKSTGEKKVSSKPAAAPSAKSEVSATSYVEMAKKLDPKEVKKARLKSLAKRRHLPAELKEGSKISKSDLCKLFPHNPEIYQFINGKGSIRQPLSKWLVDRTYTISLVGEMRSGWMRYVLDSKRLKVTWREGYSPTNKLIVTFPTIVRTDWRA